MNKLGAIIFAIILVPVIGESQSCLPDGITFTTQNQIDNFQINYPGCIEIEGSVTITSTDIDNLNGLNVLNVIQGDLWIDGSGLTDLTGLDNLSAIGADLFIWYNPLLINILALNNLTSVGGSLYLYNNPSLVSFSGLEGLTQINGSLDLHQSCSIKSLVGLDNITSIGGYFYLASHDSLESISELSSLQTIGSFIMIDLCHQLKSLHGLTNLFSVGGSFRLSNNDSLQSISDITNLLSIGGFLQISDNQILTSLVGLDNLDENSISFLEIYNNASLTTCEAQSICNYLASPNSIINIHDNSIGCNSKTEIEQACELIGISSITSQRDYRVFPNPANETITIYCSNGEQVTDVNIYNFNGQKIHNAELEANKIDISTLTPGLYLIVFAVNGTLKHERIAIH